LSPAARDLDETIRASKVADSKVADTVEQRVADIVDDADDGAFENASEVDETSVSSATDGDGQATMEEYL
jgi:hypothetical protein